MHDEHEEPALQPIAANQLRLWIHQEFDLDSNAYNVTRCLRLRGRLDPGALIGAVNALVERHEILRTVFVERGDQVCCAVRAPAPVLTGVRDVPDSFTEGDILDAAREFTLAPFDLRAEPPFRARLARISDTDHLLLLAFHHIGTDGHSLGIFEHELAQAYAAITTTGSWHGTTEPAQFGDFARWQRRTLTPATIERQLAYWREALPADLPPTSFLASSPLGATGAGPAAVHDTPVPQEVVDALGRLSASFQLTAFGVFQTAVQILAYRYSGSADVVLATTTLNRKMPRFETALGFFVNTVALHTPLGDDPTFAEALERGKRTLVGALSHDDVPFDRVVEEVSPRPPGERGALFQIAVEMQTDVTAAARRWGDVTVEVSSLEGDAGKRARGDLTLNLLRGASGMRLVVEYDAALFDEPFVAGVARALFALVTRGARHPDTCVTDLDLLDGEASAALLTARTAPPRTDALESMSEIVRSLAASDGPRTAVTTPQERLTFQELVDRAEVIAETLIDRGIDAGGFVGVIADRSADSLVALLGVWLAGCAYVPIDPAVARERQRYIIDDAGLAHILGPRGFDAQGAELIDVRAHSTGARPARRAAGNRRSTRPDDIAYAIYTSGTTGRPKATVSTHANLLNLKAGLGPAFDVPDWRRETVSLNGPLIFDVTLQQLLPMLEGATVAIVPAEVRLDPDAMLAYVAEAGITLLDVTPGHLQLLVEAGLLDRTDLPLRTLISGGEALPAPLWGPLAASPLRVFNCYGPTECTVNSTVARVDSDAERPSIGTEVAGVSLFVADDQRRLVPYGATGELYIGGRGLGPGYLHRPELTAERFVRAPWGSGGEPVRVYRTGDKVRLAKGGVVEHLGRLDDQVKIRGNRVELGEVTATLMTHPEVATAVTIVDDSDDRGAVLHSFVVPVRSGPARDAVTPGSADPDPVDQEQLQRYLEGFLPAYMVPSRITRLAALPTTVVGKIDQQALRTLARQAAADTPTRRAGAPATGPSSPARPADEPERRLAELWQDILGLPAADAEAHFFSLGGHSLLAARLIARIRREFGAPVVLTTLLERPTPRRFAEHLRAHDGPGPSVPRATWQHLIELTAAPDDEPVFCLHALGGDALVYQEMAEALPVHRNVYGVFDGRTNPQSRTGWDTPEEMTRAYAAEIAQALDGRDCHLVGWSLGGLIAHGVARRLEERGVTVRSLAIWDAGCSPVRYARPRHPDWSVGPLTVLNTLAPPDAEPLSAAERERLSAEFSDPPGPDLGTRVLRAAEAVWGVRPDDEPQAVGDRAVLAALHSWLFTGWSPEPVNAPTSVVWASDSLARGVVAKTDWSRYTRSTARACEVEGTHYSIIKDPVVKRLALELAEFTEEFSGGR